MPRPHENCLRIWRLEVQVLPGVPASSGVRGDLLPVGLLFTRLYTRKVRAPEDGPIGKVDSRCAVTAS
jgi:hypothetical protein